VFVSFNFVEASQAPATSVLGSFSLGAKPAGVLGAAALTLGSSLVIPGARAPAAPTGAPPGATTATAAAGGLPETLKVGAKGTLPAEGFKQFAATVRAFKEGTKTQAIAISEIETLLAARPDLVEQFKTWTTTFSQLPSATPTAATATATALPGALAVAQPPAPGAASVLGVITAGPAASSTEIAKKEEAARPNVLADALIQSQVVKGDETCALAHMQAFPHASRTFSYSLQPSTQSPSNNHSPLASSAHANSSPCNSVSRARRTSGTLRASHSYPLALSPLTNRGRATSLVPVLPIKFGV